VTAIYRAGSVSHRLDFVSQNLDLPRTQAANSARPRVAGSDCPRDRSKPARDLNLLPGPKPASRTPRLFSDHHDLKPKLLALGAAFHGEAQQSHAAGRGSKLGLIQHSAA